MSARLPRAQYVRQRGGGNRRAMRRLVEGGTEPGLLAYIGEEPVGWIALGAREEFVRLQRSRIAKPVDDRPRWSIVYFFVRKDQRGRGLSGGLIEAAARYARSRGARLIEAYPVEPRGESMPAALAWTGIASAFREKGFVEVARRARTRPVMRKRLGRGGMPRS